MKRQILGIIVIGLMTQCSPSIVSNKTNYSSKEVLVPEIFGKGTISTPTESVFDLAFSPSGKTVYFTKRKENEKQKIMEADYENGSWTTPKISEFSTDRDETPFITANGKTLYFGS